MLYDKKMDDNTFQEQLELYFGGTTGGALGPDIISSSLQDTKSDRFKIGYIPANQFRGVDMGATPSVPNTAFLDFNSLNGATNDYDTRLLSIGGEAGVQGRGSLVFSANNYTFAGNTTNPAPDTITTGSSLYQGGIGFFLPSVNQGRLWSVKEVVWSGNLPISPVDPSIVIQLRDPVSLVPYTGQFNVTLSTGFSGTGQSHYYQQLSITRDIAGPTDFNWEEGYEKYTDESTLYQIPNVSGTFPSLQMWNKTADIGKYMVTGYVFYDTVF